MGGLTHGSSEDASTFQAVNYNKSCMCPNKSNEKQMAFVNSMVSMGAPNIEKPTHSR